MPTTEDQAQTQEAPTSKPEHALAASRPRPLRKSDGIFKLIGICESKEEGGFSWRKHELGV
ncbi:MAG: hypothetical protein HY690_00745 [Chloroflexi bacterium]|nr:hypothetical protein [Chloroflexota bacterium]